MTSSPRSYHGTQTGRGPIANDHVCDRWQRAVEDQTEAGVALHVRTTLVPAVVECGILRSVAVCRGDRTRPLLGGENAEFFALRVG